MIGLLKGYYGYKNFGDEVLLLGVIPYLFTHYSLDSLYIEASDIERLYTRLHRHQELLGDYFSLVTLIEKHTAKNYHRDQLFLGGGEVLTEGRPFPYNGRNYLFRYPKTILQGKYHLLGGIGTPTSRTARLLWKLLLSRAASVVVREKRSYKVSCAYRLSKPTVLYHDFAEDVLPKIIANLPHPLVKGNETRVLLNTNPYIRSLCTKQKLVLYAQKYQQSYYFPAEIGVDDVFFDELAQQIPHLELYDRTKYTLTHICQDMALCSGVMAARLHVLRLAKLLYIPFKPLVYQEKISTFLDQCSGESL